MQKRNEQYFNCKVNNKDVSFYCYTTDTRNGFCHHALATYDGVYNEHTRVSYLNRTWERFDYETTLKKAISKMPKEMQNPVKRIIIDKESEEQERKAEEFINDFKAEINKATPQMKQALSKIHIQSKEQAESVLKITKIFNILNGK